MILYCVIGLDGRGGWVGFFEVFVDDGYFLVYFFCGWGDGCDFKGVFDRVGYFYSVDIGCVVIIKSG